MLPFIFIAVAAIMTMIAHGVAQRFARFPALEAYRLDILGSLAGIVSFAALTTFRVPPIGWMIVIAALIRHPDSGDRGRSTSLRAQG